MAAFPSINSGLFGEPEYEVANAAGGPASSLTGDQLSRRAGAAPLSVTTPTLRKGLKKKPLDIADPRLSRFANDPTFTQQARDELLKPYGYSIDQ